MKRIFIFLPLVLLSACASKKPVVVKMPPVVSGTTLTPADMESVRYGENLKAYQVGRYIDPNTDMVMHEAHTIYRVETTAKWNLHPNVYPYPPGSLPGGPVVGIIDPAHKDSPITPEIAAEVDRQKAMSQALMADHQQMNQSLKNFQRSCQPRRKLPRKMRCSKCRRWRPNGVWKSWRTSFGSSNWKNRTNGNSSRPNKNSNTKPRPVSQSRPRLMGRMTGETNNH